MPLPSRRACARRSSGHRAASSGLRCPPPGARGSPFGPPAPRQSAPRRPPRGRSLPRPTGSGCAHPVSGRAGGPPSPDSMEARRRPTAVCSTDSARAAPLREEYDFPALKTVGGIATTPGIGTSAWFKDPDGNTLAASSRSDRPDGRTRTHAHTNRRERRTRWRTELCIVPRRHEGAVRGIARGGAPRLRKPSVWPAVSRRRSLG
jgi:hypothetical protein